MRNFDTILYESYKRQLQLNRVLYTPPSWAELKTKEVNRITLKFNAVNERFTRKRPSLKDPLIDPAMKFTFVKLPPSEIIQEAEEFLENLIDVKIAVNNCPVMANHFLLVIGFEQKAPQILSKTSIQYGLTFLTEITQSKNLLLGFNCLNSSASVDHFHYHIIYPEELLHVQTAPALDYVSDSVKRIPHLIDNFCLTLSSTESLEAFSERIYKIIAILQSMEVPHNFILCHTDRDEIRCLIVPRFATKAKSSDTIGLGVKLGVLEMAGLITCASSAVVDEMMASDAAVLDTFDLIKLPTEITSNVIKKICASN